MVQHFGVGGTVLDLTVLVLEDNETSRFVLRTVLENEGCTVLEARDAEEALRAAEERRIQLMVCDAVLRGTDGPEVVRALDEVLPGLPILFISGYPLEQLLNRGLLTSPDVTGRRVAFLQKPFLPAVFITKVKELTSGIGKTASG